MINPAAYPLDVQIDVDGTWRAQIRTASAELNALIDRINANATVIGKAIALIRGLKLQLDQAIASGNATQLRALSASMGEQAHTLAQSIAGSHAS